MKPPRIPKALRNAISSNDPDQVRACLPAEPNPLELIEVLLTEADWVGVGLVGRCHQEITSTDPDVVGSLHRLGEQITNYLGVRAILNERIPYRLRTPEEILAVYSNKATWEEMLKDVEDDPEWHTFFKERIEKTFAGADTLTEAETPDAIRSILRMEPTAPPADTQSGEA